MGSQALALGVCVWKWHTSRSHTALTKAVTLSSLPWGEATNIFEHEYILAHRVSVKAEEVEGNGNCSDRGQVSDRSGPVSVAVQGTGLANCRSLVYLQLRGSTTVPVLSLRRTQPLITTLQKRESDWIGKTLLRMGPPCRAEQLSQIIHSHLASSSGCP